MYGGNDVPMTTLLNTNLLTLVWANRTLCNQVTVPHSSCYQNISFSDKNIFKVLKQLRIKTLPVQREGKHVSLIESLSKVRFLDKL